MTNSDFDKSRDEIPSVQREQREHKLIRVEIEREMGPEISAIVTNISEQGMGGRTEGSLQPFDIITIVKKGYGRIPGEVRWVEGRNFGVLFSEPVNVDLFNFAEENKRQHFVKEVPNGHVWKGFDSITSTKRPGVTSQFSRKKL